MKAAYRPLDASLLQSISGAAVDLETASALGSQIVESIRGALSAELRCDFGCSGSVCERTVAAEDRPAGCCYVVLSLGIDGRRALVEVETGLAAALVDRLAGGTGSAFAPQAPNAVEAASLSYLALHALRAARGVDQVDSLLSPRFVELADDPRVIAANFARERSWVAVELELSVGEVHGSGRLLLPASTARRIGRHFLPEDPAGLPAEIAEAHLDAFLVTILSDFTEGDLEQLQPGDTLILPALGRTEAGLAGEISLYFESFHLHGRVDGQDFHLASIADAFTPESLVHESATQVTSLPIDVQVELSRIKMPLSKLERLKAGAIIRLDATLSEPVVLRIGGRAVAQAELVEIDGELGARILSLMS